MKRFLSTLVLAVALTGCGGGGSGHSNTSTSSTSTTPTPTPHNVVAPGPVSCKPGQGHMGCATPHQVGLTAQKLEKLPANQGLIPDVYEGNADPNFAAAKGHVVGVILKAWEYRADSKFVARWKALTRLGIWHAAYIFQHNDCAQDVNYVKLVDSVGGFKQPNVGPPIIDAEVPDAAAGLPCAVNTLKKLTGRTPIEYTSPGSNPSSFHANLEWAAGYGNYAHCPVIWTSQCIAWQYTDGRFGPFPHSVPGFAPGDISASYGIQKLVYSKPKPKATCFGQPQSNSTKCKAARAQVAKYQRESAASEKVFVGRQCPQIQQGEHWLEVWIQAHPKSKQLAKRKKVLASAKRQYRINSCAKFEQRVNYFNNQIKKVIAAS